MSYTTFYFDESKDIHRDLSGASVREVIESGKGTL